MTNADLAQAIETINYLIQTTSSNNPVHQQLTKHLKTLMDEQLARAMQEAKPCR